MLIDISVKYPFLSKKVCQKYYSKFSASLCIVKCIFTWANTHVKSLKFMFEVDFLKRIETQHEYLMHVIPSFLVLCCIP